MRRFIFSFIFLALVSVTGDIVAGDLQVTPEDDFISSGTTGGPFIPPFKEYQLTNNGPDMIWWGVYKTADWLTVNPEWGPLASAQSVIVNVSLNAQANALPEGVYADLLTFINMTQGGEETRDVNLTVVSPGGIWVAPTSYDVNLIEGLALFDSMTIGNDGLETFDYQIRTRGIGTSGIATERIKKIESAARESVISSRPVYRNFNITPGVQYMPGELLVRFAGSAGKGNVVSVHRERILNSLGGGNIKRSFRIVPGLYSVELPPDVTVEQAIQKFSNMEDVVYAQPNYRVYALSTFPNDPRFNDLWGMHNIGQSGGTEDADIDAPEAWDITTGNNEIVVAVIDTGVDYTHEDLSANMWVNEGEIPGNGLDDDGNGYVDDVYGYDFCNDDGDPWDDHYHGTHCAGTIGAVGNNSKGVAGVCWNVRIMAIKFLDSGGSGWTDDAIASVEYSVLMGANLSSNSWGGGGYDQALKDAIDAAGAAGMLFIAAAGNDSSNNDTYPFYPSSFDCDSLISVLSTDKYDNKSSFSNYGLVSVDLGAPGSNILSCEPGNQYQYLDGTSMATPHVAGTCALIWSLNPMLSNSEVKGIVLNSADKISALQGKCVSEGRLNAHKAILETKVPWLRLEPEEGSVGPGQEDIITVIFDANEMEPGVYEAEILVITNDPCHSEIIVPVKMTVKPDALSVLPEEGFEVTGPRGGPFEPNCITYTLTNVGTEDVDWAAYWAADWLQINPASGILEPNEMIDVNVCFSADASFLNPNIYEDTLIFENLVSGCQRKREMTLTVKPPDTFTQIFDGYNDLEGLMLTFTPDGSSAYYEACRQKISEFPTDPNGGTYLPMWDDDFIEIVLNDGAQVLFYGSWYDRFYVGSNGYITFGQGDIEYEATLEHHFSIPRIAPLFTDLNPSNEENISYKQLDDRVVVTFMEVPLYGNKEAKNSFQVEIFFVDGRIRITWLNIDASASVAGLSEGVGIPPFLFEPSNLSGYPICWPLGDFNKDYLVNFEDFSFFAAHWLDLECDIPYWCGKADFDFSSFIDNNDLILFTYNWLYENPWWLQPVSHWKFDEGEGDIAYDSAGSNHGTIYGAQWTTGQIGGALYFDGVNDYVSCLNDGSLNIRDNLSICLWFNCQAWTNKPNYVNGLISKRDTYVPGQIDFDWEIYYDKNNDEIWMWDSKILSFENLHVSPTTNRWYLLVVTKRGTTASFYLDGIFQGTDETSAFWGIGDKIKIGVLDLTYPVDPGFFQGAIDDVRIYNHALTDEEVWQLYQEGLGDKASNPSPKDGAILVDPNVVLSWTSGKDAIWHDVYLGLDFNNVSDATPDSNEYQGRFDVNSFDPCGLELATTYYWRVDEVTDSDIFKGDVWSFRTYSPMDEYLVSWWRFDDGQGNIAYDSIGDNDGTVYGAAWTSGQINGALSFDGSNDYVAVGDKASLELPSLTLSFWSQNNYPEQSLQGGIAKGKIFGSPDEYSYKFDFHLGQARACITNTSNTAFVVYGQLTDSNWHLWTMTVGDGILSLYKDGVIQGSKIYSGTIDYTKNFNNYSIGAYTDGKYAFDGIIDDVRIYSRALSAEEVWQLYQEGLGD